ncbi:hypothetical protein [Streptomyces sp. NPDC056982]|uniref:hypothetical protein n=1 Tax=Streptomyces sp. NPDC056982 TaxID=3345986 RepID=UPI003633967F
MNDAHEPERRTAMQASADGNARVYQVGHGNIHIGTDITRTLASGISSMSASVGAARLAELPLDQAVAVCVAMDADVAALRLTLTSPARVGQMLASMDEVRALALLASLPSSAAAAALCAMPSEYATRLAAYMPMELAAHVFTGGRPADVLALLPLNLAANMIGSSEDASLAKLIGAMPGAAGLGFLQELPSYKQAGVLREMPNAWLTDFFDEAAPYAAAQAIHDMGVERGASVLLGLSNAADVLRGFDPYDTLRIFESLGPAGTQCLLSMLAVDEAAYKIRSVLEDRPHYCDDIGRALTTVPEVSLAGLLSQLSLPVAKKVLEEREVAIQVAGFVHLPFDQICAELERMPKERARSAARHMTGPQVLSVLEHLSAARLRTLAWGRPDTEQLCLDASKKIARKIVCRASPISVYVLFRDADPPRKAWIQQKLPGAWRVFYWSWMQGLVVASKPILFLLPG